MYRKKGLNDPFSKLVQALSFRKTDGLAGVEYIYAQMHARTLNRLKQGHAEGQAVSKRSHSVK